MIIDNCLFSLSPSLSNHPRPPSQSVLNTAGGQGKTTVFLITDTQIKEEAFLEDIDSLLNTGEVPNLFASDEKAEIMEVGLDLRLIFILNNCFLVKDYF